MTKNSRQGRWPALAALVLVAGPACRELEGFSTTADEEYTGVIVEAEDLRTGMDVDGDTVQDLLAAGTRATLELRVEELQTDRVGTLTTSDGLLDAVPLRPIVKSWNDTLSGLDFPWGRLRSALYVAEPAAEYREMLGPEILVVLSLMVDDSVEVRLLSGSDRLYGFFRLTKTPKDAATADAGTE